MRAPVISVGVPTYHGWETVAQTLQSIRDQTYKRLDVLISVDDSDERSAEACKSFLGDSRFRLVMQPRRLGWVGNTNWLIEYTDGDFFCYYQQDDHTSPTFFEALVTDALRLPEASICYTDMQVYGTVEELVQVPSITGDPLSRVLTQIELLESRPYHGILRRKFLTATGGLKTNAFDSFGAEVVLTAQLAYHGEIRRVPGPLYFKRLYHGNTHTKWYDWPAERKRGAWLAMGASLLEETLPFGRMLSERQHIFLTVLKRLVSSRQGRRWIFMDEASLAGDGLDRFVIDFLELVRSDGNLDLPGLLCCSWSELREAALGRLGRSAIEVRSSPGRTSGFTVRKFYAQIARLWSSRAR